MDPIAALSADDRLSLFVGRVAREAVRLESSLVLIYAFLTEPDTPLAAPQSVDALIKRCCRMVALPPFDSETRALGEEVLEAASQANLARNRVVHDAWFKVRADGEESGPGFDQEQWRRLKRIAKNPAMAHGSDMTLGEVAAVQDALRTAAIRSKAFSWVVKAGRPEEEFLREVLNRWNFDLARQERIARGLFRLTPDGGYEETG